MEVSIHGIIKDKDGGSGVTSFKRLHCEMFLKTFHFFFFTKICLRN